VSLLLSLLLLSGPVHAAGTFGGVAVSFSAEVDQDGFDPLLDVTARPLITDNGRFETHWAPLSVSWSFLGGADKIFDRVDIAILETERDLEQGKASVTARLPGIVYDYDMRVADLDILGGGVAVKLVGDQVKMRVGMDVRTRFAMTSWVPSNATLALGIPLGVEVRSPSDRPYYLLGTLDLRPGIAMVGDAGFLFDAQLKGRGAYIIIQGDEIDMRVFADLDFAFDNAAYTTVGVSETITRVAFWEISGAAGLSLRF
jgi:hypothetical protein